MDGRGDCSEPSNYINTDNVWPNEPLAPVPRKGCLVWGSCLYREDVVEYLGLLATQSHRNSAHSPQPFSEVTLEKHWIAQVRK
jgi:hypothetical protein